jgi:hypothetical protein
VAHRAEVRETDVARPGGAGTSGDVRMGTLGGFNFDREEMPRGRLWVDKIRCTSVDIFDVHGNST